MISLLLSAPPRILIGITLKFPQTVFKGLHCSLFCMHSYCPSLNRRESNAPCYISLQFPHDKCWTPLMNWLAVSIFLCVYSRLLSIWKYFWYWLVWIHYMFWMLSPYQIYSLKTFSQYLGWSLIMLFLLRQVLLCPVGESLIFPPELLLLYSK